MNLLDAISYHQLVLASEGRTEATQRQYLFFERIFVRYLEAASIPPELDALTPINVRSAGDWYRAHVNVNASRGGEQGVRAFTNRIKILARFLKREEIIPTGTLARLRLPTVTKHLRQPFTTDELTRLWAATRSTKYPLRDEALFLVLLDTGMRIGEAATLTTDRLQLDQRRMIVGAAGKSRRERIVPIGDQSEQDGGRTMRALRVYLGVRPDRGQTGGRVFVSQEGVPLSSEGASRAVQRLGDIAGVDNAIPHRLRHTMATHYLTTYPGDELGLGRILGHLSHDVLADYVHLAANTMSERMARMSIAQTLEAPTVEPAPRGVMAPHPEPVRLLDPETIAAVPDTLQAFIAVLRSNSSLRKALLEALAGAA